MPLKPGAKLGSYEVLSLLGAGGMGEVYRARDTRLGREVAIKVLPTERTRDEHRRRRFVQEARAASALSHPNIVTVYEIESADGNDFIVMEYVPGRTLDVVIPRQGLRLAEALRIAIPIADAVARAHAAGIVHRDLKPSNIVIGPDDVVKVLDFGLAKLLVEEEETDTSAHETRTEDGDAASLSRPGTVAGTAGYMSPEQVAGHRVDARSDVFSFGAMLYEMATGRRAFAGNSSADTRAAVLREQPRPPTEVTPDLPRDLEKVILRCLQKDPDRRFQHMADVKVELKEIAEEAASGAATVGVLAPRRKRWFAAGLTGAVVLGAVGWVLWRSRGPEIPAAFMASLTSSRGIETEPTFSPDGNQLAFAWQGEAQDNWDIYIKMIGSAETRRLTTDESLDRYPSWSPDGRQIAFVRSARRWSLGTIHVVSPLGGSDRKLTEQSAVWGRLSWSPDGRWLATSAEPSVGALKMEGRRGVLLVATADGTVRSITSPEPTFSHADAAFSPDGRHLAYASCRLELTCQLEVVALDADGNTKGSARRLTREFFWMGGLAWLRDGQSVVYDDRRNGRLWRVGIAGDRPPERVEVAGFGALWPASARSRDRLAFERNQTHASICRFEVGRPPEVITTASFDWNPAFSPDGRRFAFESGRAGEGDEIWTLGIDGSHLTQLTHGPGRWQGSPRYSPDGKRIAFDSQDHEGNWGIWTIDVDGGSLRRLTLPSTDHRNVPAWSSDGRFVYFSANRNGTRRVWRISASGGPEERITNTDASRPRESADGKELYFLRQFGNSELIAVPLAGGPERKLIDCVRGSAFAVGDAGIYYARCGEERDWPLYLLDPATGREQLLGTLERAGGTIAVSPDGKTILYEKTEDDSTDLMMIENFH